MAEDETLTDNAFRGRGMEKGAFKMMKRALDLGYEGENPIYYDWYFLSETDFEECLDMLGKSSRIHLNEQYRVSKNSSIEKSFEMPVKKLNASYSGSGSCVIIFTSVCNFRFNNITTFAKKLLTRTPF